ncbi:PhzF family phenazine biosynthesis protein [Corynebacterium kalidii]|uniref:PhzF family phenazine biosynthesis protein n=1 Tax=Corynebacterium kalidii TaxID=2931982 RepID=A0A9X2B061_9CORY|nr:PhzF family phenazine biosynthesis protein [Corynebacterium kalidii]MCJ7859287.1 PhzF family phenazine biosynthesis protein [Corynebacterium kalidii]
MPSLQPTSPIRSSRSPVELLRLAAFASELGGGNPAGIVLDASTLTESAMQQIASDIGYSETAFLIPASNETDDRTLRVRYFSPEAEVPFCGHATVAAAVALAQQRGVGPFTLETAVGRVIVDTSTAESITSGGGLTDTPVTASFTSVEPRIRDLDSDVADTLLSLLGLSRSDLDEHWPPHEAYAGNWHPIIAIRTQEVFDTFSFDPDAIRALMDTQGWPGTVTIVCRQDSDDTSPLCVDARNLFPVGDITEDPATGSAAAAFGGYLRELGTITTPLQIIVRQGRHVGRPSLLLVKVPPEGGITVSGTAISLDTA